VTLSFAAIPAWESRKLLINKEILVAQSWGTVSSRF
jgi:hypothetical protein